MADEGPTTTGSINATLKLNADQFEAKIKEASAQADALDGRDIKTRVSVESSSDGGTAAVASDLEKVVQAEGHAKTATDALAKARRDAEVADNNWRIAQLNLEKVEKDANSTEQQILAARNRVITTTAQAEKTERALAEAVKAAETAEKDTAAATDRAAESSKKKAEADKGQFSALQLIIGAAPLLVAGSDAIAASSVGLGVAFAAMGAAGLLAIDGIKDQMASGTQVGNAYSDSLSVLKGDLDQLAATAAVSMLTSFEHAADGINSSMPLLNRLVAEMSSALGNITGGVLQVFLSGLQTAQPLIEEGGVELSKFVGWLDQFATSQGFQSFINYAISNMPNVVTLLENLVTTAGHILAAFAPLGPVVIGFLNGLTGVLNALPLPVLAGLVTMVLAMPAAFNLAKTAVATFGISLQLFGLEANLAVPVIGILLAAVAGLGLAAAAAATSQQSLTAATNEYTSAVEADNNAIGDHVRKQAEQALINSGAAQSAQRLGIGIGQLTDATLGNAQAQSYINGLLDTNRQKFDAAHRAHLDSAQTMQQLKSDVDNVSGAIKGNNNSINDAVTKAQLYAQAQEQDSAATANTADTAQNLADALNTLSSEYGVSTQQIQAAQQANKDANTTVGLQIATYQAMGSQYQDTAVSVAQLVGVQQSLTGHFDATTLKMQEEGDAAGLLKQALDNLNAGHLSLEQAQTAAAKAANAATLSFQQNGLAIDGNSDAALANQTALQQKVQADQAAAEAVAKSTGKTEDGTKAYTDYHDQLIAQLKAHHELTPAVQAYLDKLYDVNDFKPVPTKLEVDNSQAMTATDGLITALDSIDGRVVNIYSVEHIQQERDNGQTAIANAQQQANAFATGAAGYAYGGHVGYLAAGGIDPLARGTDTVRAMLTPGEFVVPRSSAQALDRDNPGALEYIRSHGALPPQGGSGPVTLVAYITNPWTGEQVRTTVQAVAQGVVDKSWEDASRKRVGGI